MNDRTETLTRATAPQTYTEGSYVDWSSILAGTVVASAIAFVFSTFGAALGLAIISPYDGEGSAMAALIAVGLWMLWTTISSFMAGGYIAGRMRRRVDAVSADEVSIRDGIHGLAVWGAAVLLGALLLGSSVGSVADVTTQAASAVATVADAGTAGGADAVTATTSATDMTEAEMKAAAETARIYSVISAFVLAAALMIAAAAAYWAAGMGGQHRDENRVFARFGRWT